MTFEEIMKLVEAGYKADEIRALAAEQEAGAEKPAENETPAATGAVEGETATEVSPDIKELNETIKKLSDTVSKMQEENIKNARTGSADVHADPIKKTMDEFISRL